MRLIRTIYKFLILNSINPYIEPSDGPDEILKSNRTINRLNRQKKLYIYLKNNRPVLKPANNSTI